MKPIKFDLPLNSIRIGTLDQLEENLTPEILQHFRSGKLAKWLRVRALDEQADRIEALLAADIENEVQLFKNVCEVFVGEVDENDAREAVEEYNAAIVAQTTEPPLSAQTVDIAEPKRYPMLEENEESEMAKIMAMPDKDEEGVIEDDIVPPPITMDVLPPEVQAFIKEQITIAIIQTTQILLASRVAAKQSTITTDTTDVAIEADSNLKGKNKTIDLDDPAKGSFFDIWVDL